MLRIFFLTFAVHAVFGATIIERATGDECALSLTIIDEIKSYQPVVNQIASAIVGGQFAGDTWKR